MWRKSLLGGLLFFSSLLHAQPFSCVTQSASTPTVRQGGQSELLGDLLLICTGGVTGPPVLVNFTITLNTALTSRILNPSTGAAEVLAMIDNPVPASQVIQAAGGNDPAANIFQGVRIGINTVSFTGVRYIQPGAGTRVVRFTNLRADTSLFGVNTAVFASVSGSGTISFPISNPTANLALVGSPPTLSIRSTSDSVFTPPIFGCTGNKTGVDINTTPDFHIQFSETAPRQLMRRNTATSVAEPFTTANQNIPGQLYNTESGFYNAAFPATNNLNQAGLANNGTRLIARFIGLPAGAVPFVTTSPVSTGTAGSITARLVLTDTNGAGPATPVAPTIGPYVPVTSAIAVWEVFSEDPAVLENISFGVVLSIPANLNTPANITAQLSLGPVSAASTAAGNPIPNFSTSTVTHALGQVTACLPPLTITNPAILDAATVTLGYLISLNASGAPGPYTFSLASGTLPPGLSLSSNGVISGVPTVPGVHVFSVRVQAANASDGLKEFSINVLPPVTITTSCPLPPATLGAQYALLLTASGGTPPYRWAILSGFIPGVSISANGALTGITATEGLFSFTLQAIDALGARGQKGCQLGVGAGLSVAPNALRFTTPSGLNALVKQTVSVTKGFAGDRVTTQVTTQRGGNWLSVNPLNEAIPAQFEVAASASGLQSGDYTGTVVFSVPGAQDSSALNVSFQVTNPVPARLAAIPASVQVGIPSVPDPFQRVLSLVNEGTGALAFRASVELSAGQNWLTLGETSGSATFDTPARLRLLFNPAGLTAGTYKARVRLESGAQVLLVPVVLAVSAQQRLLDTSLDGLTFTAVAGGAAVPSQNVAVLVQGAGSLNWSAASSVDPGLPPWLSLSNASGVAAQGSPGSFQVSVLQTGLGPGTYFGEIRVASTGAGNTPRYVVVILQVLPQTPNPGLLISPGGLLFTASAQTQNITLFNFGTTPLSFELRVAGDQTIFLIEPPANREVAPGGTVTVPVRADFTTLSGNKARAVLYIQFRGDPRVRAVELAISRAATGTPALADTTRNAEVLCPPGGLTIVPVTLTQGAVTATGLPLVSSARVIDTQNRPLISGTVTVALPGGPLKYLSHVQDGLWEGTLFLNAAATPATTMRIQAQRADGSATGCFDVSQSVENLGGPEISEGGVVSAASFSPGNVALGGIAAIFGANLATGTQSASGFPLPQQLAGTTVRFEDQTVPLFFSSPGQVNGILPYGLAPHTFYRLLLRRGPAQFSRAEVLVSDAQPSVFLLNAQGQGAIVHGADQNVVVDPGRPAKPGDVIVIFCEGLGPVNPPITAGSQTPGSPLYNTTLPVEVSIDGKPAAVQFSGLAPFFAGLYQINAVIPPNATPSNTVPVVIRIGRQESNSATIAVAP